MSNTAYQEAVDIAVEIYGFSGSGCRVINEPWVHERVTALLKALRSIQPSEEAIGAAAGVIGKAQSDASWSGLDANATEDEMHDALPDAIRAAYAVDFGAGGGPPPPRRKSDLHL